MSFHNSEIVESVLRDRYYSNGERRWEEIAHRVSRYVASARIIKGADLVTIKVMEKLYEGIISARIFLPNSPTLFNAGVNTPHELIDKPLESMSYADYVDIYKTRMDNGCLSACFVVPVEDSMVGIYKAVSDAALITKSGGGVGFSFSRLRPRGSAVGGTGGVSSGPVAFMEVFDTSAHVVRQGGRRRAAMMAVLRYDHPDILDFIHSKKNNDGTSVLSYFNISVDVDPDLFLELYADDGDIVLVHEHDGQYGTIKARELLNIMAKNAWKSGDPGMVFTSKHNKYSAIGDIVTFESTNPCGEQFLQSYGSCNLGSIDVVKLQEHSMGVVVNTAVSFLDDVVDINHFPLDSLNTVNRYNRDIGLGVMGVHDLLIKKKLPYYTQEARNYVSLLMAQIAKYSYHRSMKDAVDFGVAPAFEHSRFAGDEPFIPFQMSNATEELRIINRDLQNLFSEIKTKGLRNMSIGSIAPTGTISLIAETSSGIEPNFAFSYKRYMQTKDGERIELEIRPQSIAGFSGYDEDTLKETGSLYEAYGQPDHPVPLTASEIPYEAHILMQAAAQAYISNSVSKTINMPNSATVEDVELAYLTAMRSGCKGITVYRDGSLTEQVLETNKVQTREEEMEGKTRVHHENGWKTYVTVNFFKDGTPAEVFISGEKKTSAFIGRMVSLAMRGGISWFEIYDQLKKTGGYFSEIGDTINDIINGSDSHLDEHWSETNKGFLINDNGETKCPSCDGVNTIVMQSGCVECHACSWALCLA